MAGNSRAQSVVAEILGGWSLVCLPLLQSLVPRLASARWVLLLVLLLVLQLVLQLGWSLVRRASSRWTGRRRLPWQ